MKKTANVNLDLIKEIKSASAVLIVGHVRPDGDCLGAGLCVKRLCKELKKEADFVCDSDLPRHYTFLPGFDEINVRKLSDYDLVICLDCADIFRLGKYAGYLKNKKSINIDHHITNDGFGTLNYVRPDSASTCQLVLELLMDSYPIDKESALCLFCGLSTDTGHFMHSNTDTAVLKSAALLTELGVNVNETASLLYRNNTVEKTKLIARAINSMRFFHDGEICVISIMLKDLSECGCVIADTEGLTDYGMNIGSVKVAVCLTEQDRPQFKVSYRSKSVDVAAAAGVFGGGGHKMAAGCVVSGKYEDVVAKIVKSITDGMEN